MSSYKVSEPSALKFLKANGAVVDENGNVISDSSDYWNKFYVQAESKPDKILHSDGTIKDSAGNLIQGSTEFNIKKYVQAESIPAKYLHSDGTIDENPGSVSGGTSDYNDLENKPSINGVELTGNKSLESLSIASTSAIAEVKEEIQDINTDIDQIKENYLEKSVAQTQFMSSPATFVVNSNETLAAWANHTAGNDYTSVYVTSGTYTLPSGGINLTAAGTKQVEGHPSSKLVFESLTPVDGNYSAALYYTTRPTDPTYNIKNVNVECTGAPATSANNYPCAFRNCVNLTNCSGYAKATGTKAYQAAYAFYGCQNLSFCFGASSGANNGNAYTFAASSYLTNCTADETAYPAAYDSQADIIPYASCSYLVNCVSKAKNGYELTRGFFGCSYLTGCHAEMTQDASTTVTEISGFNRCSRISNCHAKITDSSGKTLTNIGGFINSTMIDNCTSEGGQIYNSSYVAKCNATAYTQSYSDDYVTAAADTAAGGWNHTGILTWKNNRWEDA